MENSKNDLKINPVESYQPPKIPTLSDLCGNSALLKKLPSRWAKNAAVITCAGIIGASVLVGCMGNRELDITRRLDHGGFASGPIYVVHLTEQEAFGIVRAQLEAAGLRFDATPPNYTVDYWESAIGLELFDSQRNVAIARIRADEIDSPFVPEWRIESRNSWIADEFAEQTDIIVGVFYNQGAAEYSPIRQDEKAIREVATESLAAQVGQFIEFLHDKEILP